MFAKPQWILLALSGLALSAHAAPGAKLDVRISTPASVLQGDVDVVVDVVVTNPTREALRVPAAQLPSDDPGTKLFSITRDGQPVPYQGAIVKRAPALNEEVVVIQPGQSLSYQVELTGAYDLSQSGRYAIEYVGLAKQNGAGANQAAPMYLWLEGRTAKAALPQASLAVGAAAASLGFTSCSASQQSTIASAVSSATNYARGAASYLAGTPAATSRYTTWFGALSTARWNTVKTHFNNEVSAFTTQAITVDCKCKTTNTYAYVYPTQPYKIYVCGAFWRAPLTGTDSKAGTLVHEMSHFNVVAGTDDWAYGQSPARSLANTDPARAIDNADSHEYFAENTPAQP
jgi:peptidyl-Lys metalloendopeptidase